jgi:hypothetical protein
VSDRHEVPPNTSRSRRVQAHAVAGKSNLPIYTLLFLPPAQCPAAPRPPTFCGPFSPPWSVRAPPSTRAFSSPQFLAFHLAHLWSYDRFHCLKWNPSGRQPGAFKRFMSVRLPPPSLPALTPSQYTYLATLSCLVCFGVAFTFIKFQEGAFDTPRPVLLSPVGRLRDDRRRPR